MQEVLFLYSVILFNNYSWNWVNFFFREFQPMASAPDDDFLSSD